MTEQEGAGSPLYWSESQQAVMIRVRAKPGAKRAALGPIQGDHLRVAVPAPPEKGKANAAIARALADLFRVSPSSVELQRGGGSRDKVFAVHGVTMEQAIAALRNAGLL